ncbi:MAG: ribosomal protein S18-alanine N-acetyltransferase [Candidatus Eisenbacteria sp.]|nr:ribosomal protein S18-alanine N-acetyltransferase [Candidatus Eisenbacteria bacterium]
MRLEGMEIRRMQAGDVPGVVDIERRAFAMAWTCEMFLKEIAASADSVPLVMHLEGRLVAYAILWRVGRRFHVANIAVDERYQRRGLGTLLIRRVFEEALKRDCSRVSLETRVSNRVAINLFRKVGFRTVTVSHGYYTDNDEDALVMVRAIGKAVQCGKPSPKQSVRV